MKGIDLYLDDKAPGFIIAKFYSLSTNFQHNKGSLGSLYRDILSQPNNNHNPNNKTNKTVVGLRLSNC